MGIWMSETNTDISVYTRFNVLSVCSVILVDINSIQCTVHQGYGFCTKRTPINVGHGEIERIRMGQYQRSID